MPFKYFQKLPVIEYPLDKTRNKKSRDILHRIYFDQKLLDKSDYLRSYKVKDGDRPEIISSKLYGRSDVYSIIMLLNGFDSTMFSGLPPHASVYDEYINEKYYDDVYYVVPTDNPLALTSVTGVSAGLSGGYIYPIFGRGFVVGERIFGAGADGYQIYEKRAYVKDWDPVMSCLKLDVISGSFEPGLTLSRQDQSIYFKIGKKVIGKEAVHHFEFTRGQTSSFSSVLKGGIADPLSRFEESPLRIAPMGIYNEGITGDYYRTLIYRYITNNLFWSASDLIKPVTFYEYEMQTQESKRKIMVPSERQELLGVVVDTVTELLESIEEE